MIGILKKDLYMLYGAYKKNLLLVFLLYGAMVLIMKNTFLLAILIWIMSFYSLSAISMDNSCGWDRYVRTLPVSSGTVIAARFLACFVMLCVGVAFAAVTAAILYCFLDYGEIGPLMVMIALVTAGALFTSGLILPAAYKWGVEKARNTTLLLFALVFFGLVMLKKWTGSSSLDELEILLSGLSLTQLSVWPLGIGLLVFAFGGWLSSRIYAKKEF